MVIPVFDLSDFFFFLFEESLFEAVNIGNSLSHLTLSGVKGYLFIILLCSLWVAVFNSNSFFSRTAVTKKKTKLKNQK